MPGALAKRVPGFARRYCIVVPRKPVDRGDDVHAGGIDQPLEIVRMDTWQPFSGIPHANWRGTYDVVTFTGSRYAECGPHISYELGTAPECFPSTWPR